MMKLITEQNITIKNKKLYDSKVFDLCGEMKGSGDYRSINMILSEYLKNGQIVDNPFVGKFKKNHFEKSHGFKFK